MKFDPYRPICRYITMPLWAKWEKSSYLKHLKFQKQFQYEALEVIERFQFDQIRKLIAHAYNNSPFYNELYASNHIHPRDIKFWKDVEQLPIITKKLVRENQKKMLAGGIPETNLVPGMTSGSTGKPLHFFSDEAGSQKERASIILIQEWAGHHLGGKLFSMFGQSTSAKKNGSFKKLLRKKLLSRSHNLSTLRLTETSMAEFYHLLKNHRKPFIYGYAHTLFLFAEFLEKNNWCDVNAGGILSGGMVLYDHQRRKIENIFNCGVTDNYGCEEFGVIASECEQHHGLHINAANKYIEILKENGQKAPAGEAGNIIVTSLTNYGMPFIRYRIEDKATASDRCCSCGRGYPLLEKIDGRESDFIVTPEGTMVSGISLTDNFGAKIPGVDQIQLIQDKTDHIILKTVKNESFNENSLEAAKDLNNSFFGKNMKFTFDFVDEIPPSPGGKTRFVISKIKSEDRA
ncbi:MAG: phenylacetate--CoA ligase family protein [Syntrophaceae bacterium]|nr:phenylacetate--CoA ligase family protein [Syntrophaceae bacterium]